MVLYSKILGEGAPVIILHGLLGMSENWLSHGKTIAGWGYNVHLLDLRNHGRSPHSDTHRYPDMCDDLLRYTEQQNIDKFTLIGHSMGGKLGMMFTLQEPEMVKKLIVVDMAPVDYRPLKSTFHKDIIETLRSIDVTQIVRKTDLLRELQATLEDKKLAHFLAKNLRRQSPSEPYQWLLNLDTLKKFADHIKIGLDELDIYAPATTETLFVTGEQSAYYRPEYDAQRFYFFPESKRIEMKDAGHWLHIEQPELFLDAVRSFL